MSQTGPRFLTLDDINTLVNLTPTNTPANQPATMHDEYGAIGQDSSGRGYRFVSFAGTSTIEPGLLLVQAVQAANTTGLAISATQPSTTATGSGATGASALAAGSLSFNVTNGSTPVTLDEFGYVESIVNAGGTYMLKLRGNTAAAATTGTITLYLADPLPPTITTLVAGTDTVNLVYNPYTLPIATKNAVGTPIGVTVVSVPNTSTSAYAGWVQTHGPAFVQATSGTLGYAAVQDLSGTAGYLVNATSTTVYEQPIVGVYSVAEASSTAQVFLKID